MMTTITNCYQFKHVFLLQQLILCVQALLDRSLQKMWNIDFSKSCREVWSFIHCDFLVLFMHLDDSPNFSFRFFCFVNLWWGYAIFLAEDTMGSNRPNDGNVMMDDKAGARETDLPFRELTYPIKNHFWVDDFPNFPRWDMLYNSLEGSHFDTLDGSEIR